MDYGEQPESMDAQVSSPCIGKKELTAGILAKALMDPAAATRASSGGLTPKDALEASPIISYDGPRSQVGKRKFHSGLSLSSVSSSPSSFRSAATCSTKRMRADDEEDKGLSLLLEASLLQEQNAATAARRLGLERNLPPSNFCLSHHDVMGTATATASGNEVKNAPALATDIAITPTEDDVLCGRGGGVNKHMGNIIYRRVVEYNKEIYKTVPKRQRIMVSQSIVQGVLKFNGRFLQRVNDTWQEVEFRRAVQKTSQALREKAIMDSSTTNEAKEDT